MLRSPAWFESLLRRTGGILLSALVAASVPSLVRAQQTCEIEPAQKLFGQQPRPTARIRQMLADCRAAGSTDYRIFMFEGVMARDAGDRERAIEWLRQARQADPNALNPALELAYTLEAGHPREARQAYDEILERDPASRAALLGRARVARSESHLSTARSIYERMLTANPKDPDALNGMAWLALANREREEGRIGFERVLALEPGNEEARVGLSKVENVYRYVLEMDVILVSTATNSSWGPGARSLIALTAFDTVELGYRRFTNELLTLTSAGVGALPSDDVTLGFHRLVPLRYGLSLVYDFRTHSRISNEHWIEGGMTFYLTDWLRWFGSYRQAFGALQWDGRLIRTGFSVAPFESWEVSATLYDSAQAVFNNYQDVFSWVVDVSYHGPNNLFVTAGVGYTPLFQNLDLHARAIVPVTERVAVQVAFVRNSVNADTRGTIGLRFNW